MFRWIELLVLIAVAILAWVTALPHLAKAVHIYGGGSFSPSLFVSGFSSALYVNAATGAQITDFLGMFSATLLFSISEGLRMRTPAIWVLIAFAPLGLLAGLFPAVEAVRVWRRDTTSVGKDDSDNYIWFRIILFALVALLTGTVTAHYMHAYFGPDAWLQAYNMAGAESARFVEDMKATPASAALGANLMLPPLAFFFILVVDAVRTRAWIIPALLFMLTPSLGITTTLPLFLLYRLCRELPARRSNTSTVEPHPGPVPELG